MACLHTETLLGEQRSSVTDDSKSLPVIFGSPKRPYEARLFVLKQNKSMEGPFEH